MLAIGAFDDNDDDDDDDCDKTETISLALIKRGELEK